MPESPNKLSQFWQELKRRNVHRSVAIYAGSAFVFLEAATIIFPRWGLPDWSIDLVLYLLILGVFITFIVSWIFDITPQGVQKTKPLEEITETEKPADSKVWKAATYISLVIIVGLITFNIVGGPKQLRTGDIQSLVILPFDNYTGDDSLEYFVSGMHASLINDVGRLGGLRVICKTSSNVYKDVDMTASEIAKELNVDAVMETSVMCLGDTICVQYKLVDATGEERQLYISDIKEEKSRILGLFNRITRQIADEIKIELTPREEQLLAKSRTVDREAYDSYLKGVFLRGDFSPEILKKSRDYLNSAIEKDPDWAPLYAGLATVWLTIAQMGIEPPEIAAAHIFENLNKALELDPDNADSHGAIGMVAFLTEWDWEKAEKEFLKALAANPSNAGARIIYAQLLNCLQRNDEALIQGRLAIELDPLNPGMWLQYSHVLMGVGDFETALAYGEKVTADDPGHSLANSLIENAAFACGEYDKVMEAAKYILPAKGVDFKEVERIYWESGFVAAYEEIMRQLEVLAQKGYSAPVDVAIRYMMVDRLDKAMGWLEKGFEAHDPNMPYIATHSYLFDPLFDNPRFIEILEKMNLPMPED